MLNKYIKIADQIINRLQARVNKLGYDENLGRRELSKYVETVMNDDRLSYFDAQELCKNLALRIEEL